MSCQNCASYVEARLRIRPEHAAEAGAEAVLGQHLADQHAGAGQQQLLQESRPERLRKQAAVEQAHRFQGQAGLVTARPLLLPRQQFLRHRVAVAVADDVDAAHAERGEQALLQVGLVGDGVVVVARLGRIAEADHVGGDDRGETLAQRGPQPVPVPGRDRRAMQQQQHRTGAASAAGLVEHRMAAMHIVPAMLVPVLEGDGLLGWL